MSTKTNAILDKIKEQYNKNMPKEKKAKLTEEEWKDILKKYFNIIKEGDYTFRILPAKNDESPFIESYFHHLKVNGKWTKLYCPHKNDGEQCPLCEAEDALKSTGKQEDFELSRTYQAKLFYIVKGIDRNNLEDGVKFWRFKHNYKQQGIFDKIMPVFAKKGDITDPINGRDLVITAIEITETNNISYVTVSSIMPDDISRLVESDTSLKELVNDKTGWKDVFKSKGKEYLQQVVEGKAPYWDDNQNKFITPGKSKKVLKDIFEDKSDEITFETLSDNSNSDKLTETKKTSEKTIAKKVLNKIKKQTEDIFETSTVSEEKSDDLPF